MIYTIMEVLATLSDMLFLVWFTTRFLNVSLKSGKRPWCFILPITLFVYQIVVDKLSHAFDIISLTGVFVISVLFTLSVGNWERNKFSTLIAPCLFISVEMVSGSAVYASFSMFIDDIDDIMLGATDYERIIYVLVATIVRFIMFKLILLLFKSDDAIDKKNGYLAIGCFVLMVVGLSILMYISVQYPMVKPSIVFALVMLFTCSNIILYFMIYQIQKYRKKEYEYRLIRERVNLFKASADEATRIWENIRRVRHEMKNHLTLISGKLNMGDVDGCKSYLSDMIGNLEHFGDIVKTDNAVIDYLINAKLTCLDNTKVVVSGYVGDFDDISDSDLACLVGNILDNAVEAENKITDAGKRFIELHFLIQNQNRIIVCKNAIEKSVLDTNKELRTTKKDTVSHGLGHQIISDIAAKYYGFVEYSEVNDMFCVQIVLPKSV